MPGNDQVGFGNSGGGDDSSVSTSYGTPFGYTPETGAKPMQYYDTYAESNSVETPGVAPTRIQKDGAVKDAKGNPTKTYANVFDDYRLMRNKDPQGFQSLQMQLYQGGFYNEVQKGAVPKFGQFDALTTKALNLAMSQALLEGAPVEDILNERVQYAQQNNQNQTQPYETNTENITSAVKALGPQILGREVPDEVVNKIVATLHGSQDAAAQGQTGNQTAVSGDQAWYAEQLKELMPHTAKAYQTFEGLMSANFGPVNNLGSNG